MKKNWFLATCILGFGALGLGFTIGIVILLWKLIAATLIHKGRMFDNSKPDTTDTAPRRIRIIEVTNPRGHIHYEVQQRFWLFGTRWRTCGVSPRRAARR